MARKSGATKPNRANPGGNGQNGQKRSKKGKGGVRGPGANPGGPYDPPVAVGATLSNRAPTYKPAPGGQVRLTNTEFVQDVAVSAGAPTIIGYDLNPNSTGLFTWLAKVAPSYDLFRFERLRLTYTPMCATTTQGVAVFGVDYNASDAAPVNKQSLSGYSDSVRSNVWNSISVDVKVPPGWFYVGQQGSLINPTGTDIKFYDVAKVYFGLFNTTGTATVGEISVSYDVCFSKPQLSIADPLSDYVITTNPQTTTPLGSAQTVTGNLPISLVPTSSTSFNMVFSTAGSYLIEMASGATNAASTLSPPWFVQQTDPGGSPVTVSWSENVNSGWVNGSTVYTNLGVITFVVVPGTLISFALQVATAYVTRMRLAGYKKALG